MFFHAALMYDMDLYRVQDVEKLGVGRVERSFAGSIMTLLVVRSCLGQKITTMATAAVVSLDSKKKTIVLADIVATVENAGSFF